jgi:hypothetical protein
VDETETALKFETKTERGFMAMPSSGVMRDGL